MSQRIAYPSIADTVLEVHIRDNSGYQPYIPPSSNNDDRNVMEDEDLVHLCNMIDRNNQHEFDLNAEYEAPSMEVALANRRYLMPMQPISNTQYALWGTTTGRFTHKKMWDCFHEKHRSDLIPFGAGVSAYFKLIKSMSILFGAFALLATPFMYINAHGGEHFQHHPLTVSMTMFGNLFPGVQVGENGQIYFVSGFPLLQQFFSSGCSNASYYSSCTKENALLFYCIWDAALIFVYFVAVNVLLKFTRNESGVFRRKIAKIEDYTVQISVPLGATADSIKFHFEHTLQYLRIPIKVQDVQIVENTGGAVALCVQRGHLLKRLARLDAKHRAMLRDNGNAQAVQTCKQSMDELTEKINNMDDLAQVNAAINAETNPPVMGFVTFETQQAKFCVLAEYGAYQGLFSNTQPPHMFFDKREPLQVTPAPAPSTILWENQEVTTRAMRGIAALFLFTAILLVSALLSYLTDQNRFLSGSLNRVVIGAVFCDNRYSNYTSVPLQAAAARQNGDEECYCDNLGANPLNTSSDSEAIAELCNDYWNQTWGNLASGLAFSFLVVVINMVIYRVVTWVAVHLMRFGNVLQREMAVMRVLFVITLINTGLIILLVNTNWGLLLGNTGNWNAVLKDGDYVDFEPGWYSQVGVEIFLLSVLNIFGPYVVPLMRYVYHLLEQRFAAKRAISQQQLNDLFIGEEFLLSVRLAQTMCMVFFTLAFSSGIPVLYWTAFASFVVAFWVDKFFFLRLARTPPQFDTALQQWALRTLEWAAIVHCLLGFWMYSSVRVLPSGGGLATPLITPGVPVLSLDFSYRITYSAGPGILLLVGVFLILFKCFRGCCGGCFSSCFRPCCGASTLGGSVRVVDLNRDADKFSDLVAQRKLAGLTSYNILANPRYRTMFQLQRVDVNGLHSLQDALNARKDTTA